MRIGPIHQQGFDELGSLWFYHAIGSGIFFRTASFMSIDVQYDLGKSVPRVEIVGRLPPAIAAAQRVYTRPKSRRAFWPSAIHFETHDGRACTLTAIQTGILSCTEVPRLPSPDLPWPSQPFYDLRHTLVPAAGYTHMARG